MGLHPDHFAANGIPALTLVAFQPLVAAVNEGSGWSATGVNDSYDAADNPPIMTALPRMGMMGVGF
jgi:hypothetical protein